jgi:hypothetical protein
VTRPQNKNASKQFSNAELLMLSLKGSTDYLEVKKKAFLLKLHTIRHVLSSLSEARGQTDVATDPGLPSTAQC